MYAYKIPFFKDCPAGMRASGSHTPDRRSFKDSVCLTGQAWQVKVTINQFLSCEFLIEISIVRRPPKTFEKRQLGCHAASSKPSPRSPVQLVSPATPSIPSPTPAKHKHLLASRGKGKGNVQESQDYGIISTGRWLTNAAGTADRGVIRMTMCGGHGMLHSRPSIRRALPHTRDHNPG